MEIKCRLCSSETALISLFSGKCRKSRDYLRKLIEFTTGIKFEKDDAFKCICYPCTVQVYNFYIFKARSIENEKVLEGHIKKTVETKSKMKFLNLDNIILPDINELQSELMPWLMSKSNCLETTTGNGDNINVDQPFGESIKNEYQTANNSTQCDPVQSFNKCTQCFVPSISEYTQTKEIVTKSKEIECYLIRNEKDSIKQTEMKMVDKAVQHVQNCYEKDAKCDYNNLKQELDVLSALKLCPINSLNVTGSPNKITSFASPVSSHLPSPKGSSKDIIICRFCRQMCSTKEAYQVHRKCHMVCNLCKKKFTSVKQTTWHLENQCERKNILRSKLVVQLVQLDQMKEVRYRYPKCIENLNILRKEKAKVRPILRLRSRSISSADSFYSCCSCCSTSVTILQDLKLGIDKSVQTNLLSFVSENGVLKANSKHWEDSVMLEKKRKLSHLLNG